ncbi:MAG TPA: SIS domain-containing protein [Acidimicrobiales bacterium]|nr:SIS domain-containing protein [Acidimicrobiales bacterium]
MTSTYPATILSPPDFEDAVCFPTTRHARASTYLSAYFRATMAVADSIDIEAVERAADLLLAAYSTGACVFSCGNGGSAAIANHLQCDHLKGVQTGTDLTPRVISLSSSVELLTAIANDISYHEVFAYQLQSQSRPGDVLIAISSSGQSANVVRALGWARDHGLSTIALTGFEGGEARSLADVSIHVASANYGIIEDLHQAVMHTMAQFVRQSRMSPDTIATTTF